MARSTFKDLPSITARNRQTVLVVYRELLRTIRFAFLGTTSCSCQVGAYWHVPRWSEVYRGR